MLPLPLLQLQLLLRTISTITTTPAESTTMDYYFVSDDLDDTAATTSRGNLPALLCFKKVGIGDDLGD